jgi:hypothetical protein
MVKIELPLDKMLAVMFVAAAAVGDGIKLVNPCLDKSKDFYKVGPRWDCVTASADPPPTLLD